MKTAKSSREQAPDVAAWRRPLLSLRGLHIPIGLHLSALAVQAYWWTEEILRCTARQHCTFPWLDAEQTIVAGLGMALVLYFWLGFGCLHALLDRSLAPFRKTPHLVLAMLATSAVAFVIAAALPLMLREPKPFPDPALTIY